MSDRGESKDKLLVNVSMSKKKISTFKVFSFYFFINTYLKNTNTSKRIMSYDKKNKSRFYSHSSGSF